MKHSRKLAVIVAAALCLVMALALCACGNSGQSTASTATSAPTSSPSVSDDPFYVLLVGNDSRTGTTEITKAEYADGNARSDVMMLVRVDPASYKITIVTVPRDTEATINGSKNKINEAYHVGGIDSAKSEVEKLTGVTIKYCMDIDFVKFESFVNKIGGVTASVPIDMYLDDIVNGGRINLSAGSQSLNGPQALVLARVRKLYANDLDACRQIQDRQLVQAFISKVAKDPASQATYITDLMSYVKTDMSTSELTAYVSKFVSNADKITFISGTGPYAGDIDAATQLWLVLRDETTWKKVIQVVNQGGDPTTVIALPKVAAA